MYVAEVPRRYSVNHFTWTTSIWSSVCIFVWSSLDLIWRIMMLNKTKWFSSFIFLMVMLNNVTSPPPPSLLLTLFPLTHPTHMYIPVHMTIQVSLLFFYLLFWMDFVINFRKIFYFIKAKWFGICSHHYFDASKFCDRLESLILMIIMDFS